MAPTAHPPPARQAPLAPARTRAGCRGEGRPRSGPLRRPPHLPGPPAPREGGTPSARREQRGTRPETGEAAWRREPRLDSAPGRGLPSGAELEGGGARDVGPHPRGRGGAGGPGRLSRGRSWTRARDAQEASQGPPDQLCSRSRAATWPRRGPWSRARGWGPPSSSSSSSSRAHLVHHYSGPGAPGGY